ncbi:Na+/H+ antiporter subunit D [Myxococcota bacterium]|nr:Na+/H+ antiporter subunit D [Myxococcota bacterium]
MKVLLVLPVIVPLATAALCFTAWRRPRLQGALSVSGAAALLVAAIALLVSVRGSGIRATQMGAWPAPFGITFVADLFSAIMTVLAGIIGLAIVVSSTVTVDGARKAFGHHPNVHVLLAGVCGAFLTGDIFNLYVWFEVMLISSFVLLALGGERPQLEGSIKYVTLNLISSALFLAAVGILYGITGTLNMADLSTRLPMVPHATTVTATALLFLVAFGIKAAVFPMFFWLPASYPTPPSAISALFAGLLTKVGVYALVRVFTLLFTREPQYTHTILLWIAGLTMVTGVLGAVAQSEMRKLLAFHIVSQIGYMVMGLALFGPRALTGAIFYIAHNILAKTNLFLVSGVVHELRGTYELKRLGGLYRDHPGLALAFLASALSLAGLPPLSGFFAKLTLVQAGVDARQFPIVATALVVGLLTLFSMTKIWDQAFWKPANAQGPERPPKSMRWPDRLALFLPITGLATLTVVIGLWPDPLLALSRAAAEQLLDPSRYVRAVLEARR